MKFFNNVLIVTYYINNLAPPYLMKLLEVYEPSCTLTAGDQLNLRVLKVPPQIIWCLGFLLCCTCFME